MTIPKEIIEKAIQGGWSTPTPGKWIENEGWYAHVALDPSFWQALGKSLGWGEGSGGIEVWDWHGYARNFYDHILQGHDTDEFWKELLKENI